MDPLGNMVRDPALIAEPLNWTADARLALAIKVGTRREGVVGGRAQL